MSLGSPLAPPHSTRPPVLVRRDLADAGRTDQVLLERRAGGRAGLPTRRASPCIREPGHSGAFGASIRGRNLHLAGASLTGTGRRVGGPVWWTQPMSGKGWETWRSGLAGARGWRIRGCCPRTRLLALHRVGTGRCGARDQAPGVVLTGRLEIRRLRPRGVASLCGELPSAEFAADNPGLDRHACPPLRTLAWTAKTAKQSPRSASRTRSRPRGW